MQSKREMFIMNSKLCVHHVMRLQSLLNARPNDVKLRDEVVKLVMHCMFNLSNDDGQVSFSNYLCYDLMVLKENMDRLHDMPKFYTMSNEANEDSTKVMYKEGEEDLFRPIRPEEFDYFYVFDNIKSALEPCHWYQLKQFARGFVQRALQDEMERACDLCNFLQMLILHETITPKHKDFFSYPMDKTWQQGKSTKNVGVLNQICKFIKRKY